MGAALQLASSLPTVQQWDPVPPPHLWAHEVWRATDSVPVPGSKGVN